VTRILITGGAGFIGSNFVHYILETHPSYHITVVDKLTYAGNLKNLEAALSDYRLRFVRMDICDAGLDEAIEGCELAVHFAAESHVDRSIEDATVFVRSNAEGSWRLIEACRRRRVRRFVHVSTDEVYGSLGPAGKFTEDSPLAPTSPYAASKAASDLLLLAAVKTHGFPGIITRCSNNYGPYQFPEKFIPLMISQALENQPLPIYGDGKQVRDWIHVTDHCRALDAVLHHGQEGEIYNISAHCERINLDVAREILRRLGRPDSLLQSVADRPAHDRRYALDSAKLRTRLNWTPQKEFEQGLTETIAWYQNNAEWLALTKSGEYRDYFDRHYTRRAASSSGATQASS